MRRDSTKHGPRVDDELASEQLADEAGEVVAEGDIPVPVELDRSETAPSHPPSDPVEARRELSRHLRLSVFPASRDALVEEANDQGAPEHVLFALRQLPADLELHTVHEVWTALEGHEDVRDAARHDPLTDADR